jgi:hypothetical protein
LRKLSCAVVLFLAASSLATAETRDLQAMLFSGEQRVALVELFTSEGCSSCPPADRWLSDLQEEPGLWKDYVPVAFHVDYWDYIGWKDRFARAEYSARQRQYVAEGGANFVYTPGVFLQGVAWSNWRTGKPVMADRSRVGNLSVSVDDGIAAIHFENSRAAPGPLTAHVALLGMNLDTAVRSGENRDRKLHHDFVVLNVVSVPLDNTASGYTANTPLPDTTLDANDLALAIWVSASGTQRPIQSVGGLLL